MNCLECGLPAKHNHHVVPKVFGGTKTVPLCETCHGLVHQHDLTTSGLTKAGLRKARQRGVKLGKPENLTDQARAKGTQRHVENARVNPNNRKAGAMAEQLRSKGRTLREIADDLNRLGFAASRGGQFSANQVKRLLDAQ